MLKISSRIRVCFMMNIYGLSSVLFLSTALVFVAASSYPSSPSFISSVHPTDARPPTRVVVVGGTHGNEYTGVWCIKALERSKERLRSRYPFLDVTTLLANPDAFLANKRFVDCDLNREFTEAKLATALIRDTVESRQAHRINAILGPKVFDYDDHGENREEAADVVVDLHTTTTNMGITLIVSEGDPVMAQAAAYVMNVCSRDGPCCVCMHSHASKAEWPSLSSTGRHGFTIEVGPVPQGVLRHDKVDDTNRALHALLDFLDHNQHDDDGVLLRRLRRAYAVREDDQGPTPVPCYRSAPAVKEGEMSGKIVWPCDDDNPNFPAVLVHESIQDRDFCEIRTGDPLFVRPDGTIVTYDGSHGDAVHLMFVNEGGYYYQSSGTGISVAIKSAYDLDSGMVLQGSATAGRDVTQERAHEKVRETVREPVS